jgi:hypothetical protein
MSTTGSESSKGLWVFLVLLCVWSWPIWFLSGVLPRAGTGVYDFRWLVAQIGVFGPSLAALIVSAIFRPESRRRSLRTIPILLVPLVVPGVDALLRIRGFRSRDGGGRLPGDAGTGATRSGLIAGWSESTVPGMAAETGKPAGSKYKALHRTRFRNAGNPATS